MQWSVLLGSLAVALAFFGCAAVVWSMTGGQWRRARRLRPSDPPLHTAHGTGGRRLHVHAEGLFFEKGLVARWIPFGHVRRVTARYGALAQVRMLPAWLGHGFREAFYAGEARKPPPRVGPVRTIDIQAKGGSLWLGRLWDPEGLALLLPVLQRHAAIDGWPDQSAASPQPPQSLSMRGHSPSMPRLVAAFVFAVLVIEFVLLRTGHHKAAAIGFVVVLLLAFLDRQSSWLHVEVGPDGLAWRGSWSWRRRTLAWTEVYAIRLRTIAGLRHARAMFEVATSGGEVVIELPRQERWQMLQMQDLALAYMARRKVTA